jgi:hypothetical protein
MLEGSIFFFFFLNVQTWQSHDAILLLKGNAEESVSSSVPTQPNQLCMRVSLKHCWAGLNNWDPN